MHNVCRSSRMALLLCLVMIVMVADVNALDGLTPCLFFFFFNDTATTEIYTLSLHDALPIYPPWSPSSPAEAAPCARAPRSSPNRPRRAGTATPRDSRPAPRRCGRRGAPHSRETRSEEHTSELQSRSDLVCRLLLEKKKNKLGELRRDETLELLALPPLLLYAACPGLVPLGPLGRPCLPGVMVVLYDIRPAAAHLL